MGKQKGGEEMIPGETSEAYEPAGKIAALTVKRMALADLRPHPRNDALRRHPEPGTPRWDALKASLAQSYFDPLCVNSRNGYLVSGHLRLKVLRAEGYTHADVSVVDYDEPTHLARMLAANQGIGEDLLPGIKDLLEELDTGAFDIQLAGFSLPDVESLLTSDNIDMTSKANAKEADTIRCPKCGFVYEEKT